MPKRSHQQLAKLRTDRRIAAAEALRLELRQRYPSLPANIWSNLGDGGMVGGAGAKTLRAWLRSLYRLIKMTDGGKG